MRGAPRGGVAGDAGGQGFRHALPILGGGDERGFGVVGQVGGLNQHRGALHQAQHGETGSFQTAIKGAQMLQQAVVQVPAELSIPGIEGIARLDDTVTRLQAGTGGGALGGGSEYVGLGTLHLGGIRHGVEVNADEQVGRGRVGPGGAVGQGNESVVGPGIDDP